MSTPPLDFIHSIYSWKMMIWMIVQTFLTHQLPHNNSDRVVPVTNQLPLLATYAYTNA